MIKLSAIILLASLVYYTQCLPAKTQAGTKTESDNKLQLYVNNGTQGLNYHLSAVVSDLESEDQQINAELNAILPFLNFLVRMIDVVMGQSKEDNVEESNYI